MLAKGWLGHCVSLQAGVCTRVSVHMIFCVCVWGGGGGLRVACMGLGLGLGSDLLSCCA